MTVKKLMPRSEEIDEIISKLKKFRIKEICDKLGLKEHIELGKKPWYMFDNMTEEIPIEEWPISWSNKSF